MNWARGFLVFAAVVGFGGCATVPTGPSVMVLPAQGKPFEAFQADDSVCRQWAAQQAGAGPSETTNQNLASAASRFSTGLLVQSNPGLRRLPACRS